MFGINEIWFLIGIPLLATIYLLISHRKETTWYEILSMWAISIITIFITQITVEYTTISDEEFWGFNGVKAVYDEPFQYWDTCSETYACGTTCPGVGKNRSCSTKYCTRYYPCTKWGGDDAWLIDQNNNSRYISRSKFKFLESQKWRNSQTIELHRENEYKIIQDGDRRVTIWPKTWQTAEPIVERHTYKNRTQSTSTIRFKKVTEEEKEKFKLFDYPCFFNSGYEMITILDSSGRYWSNPDQYFRYLNGILGPKKFVRIWVLIFRDQSREIFHYQEGLWKNGNKNEFIICIGADKSNNIQWGGVISWTEIEELKIEFRDYIEMKMKEVSNSSLIELAEYTEKAIGSRYIKPEFTEKFKHLSIQPSVLAMSLSAVFILLVNIGMCVYIVKNQFGND